MGAKRGKLKVESGKWKVESGAKRRKWKMESGQWTVENGAKRRLLRFAPFPIVSFQLSALRFPQICCISHKLDDFFDK